jgi:hypothetical protein
MPAAFPGRPSLAGRGGRPQRPGPARARRPPVCLGWAHGLHAAAPWRGRRWGGRAPAGARRAGALATAWRACAQGRLAGPAQPPRHAPPGWACWVRRVAVAHRLLLARPRRRACGAGAGRPPRRAARPGPAAGGARARRLDAPPRPTQPPALARSRTNRFDFFARERRPHALQSTGVAAATVQGSSSSLALSQRGRRGPQDAMALTKSVFAAIIDNAGLLLTPVVAGVLAVRYSPARHPGGRRNDLLSAIEVAPGHAGAAGPAARGGARRAGCSSARAPARARLRPPDARRAPHTRRVAPPTDALPGLPGPRGAVAAGGAAAEHACARQPGASGPRHNPARPPAASAAWPAPCRTAAAPSPPRQCPRSRCHAALGRAQCDGPEPVWGAAQAPHPRRWQFGRGPATAAPRPPPAPPRPPSPPRACCWWCSPGARCSPLSGPPTWWISPFTRCGDLMLRRAGVGGRGWDTARGAARGARGSDFAAARAAAPRRAAPRLELRAVLLVARAAAASGARAACRVGGACCGQPAPPAAPAAPLPAHRSPPAPRTPPSVGP